MTAYNLVITALAEHIKVSVVSGLVLAFSFLYYLYQKTSDFPLDPHEPPLIKSIIPYMGHAVSEVTRQLEYFTDLQFVSLLFLF